MSDTVPGHDRGWPARLWRGLVLLVLALLGLTLVWWAVGRATVADRRLSVHRLEAAIGTTAASTPGDTTAASAPGEEIRVLAWNIAHGRGDAGPGLLRNFRGGSEEERVARLARIAAVIRRADADVVVLNEVDFEAIWSGGLNQAEVLARAARYRTRVEQINYDIRLPFASLSFGNALLARPPVRSARWVDLPPHSRLEALAGGAKSASVVRLETRIGSLAVVPIHLEVRSGETRRAALPALKTLRREEDAPLVLAGDFNASPPGWPGAGATTVVGQLLDRGWESPRARGAPGATELTYPMPGPRRAIDWILVEPSLRVTEARVLEADPELSDHAPVLAVIRAAPNGSPLEE